MGLWDPGSDGDFPGFGMGITLVDFQTVQKYPNMVKKLSDVEKSLAREIS
jgi:hypothetical protein